MSLLRDYKMYFLWAKKLTLFTLSFIHLTGIIRCASVYTLGSGAKLQSIICVSWFFFIKCINWSEVCCTPQKITITGSWIDVGWQVLNSEHNLCLSGLILGWMTFSLLGFFINLRSRPHYVMIWLLNWTEQNIFYYNRILIFSWTFVWSTF